jgi:hypothetical protein
VSGTQARLDESRWDEFRSWLDGYDMPDWVYVDADELIDRAAELERVTAALRAIRDQGDAWSAEIADQALCAGGARAAQEPPHPDETDDVPHPAAHADTLPCGHPRSAVVSADEGTSYCGGCAQENERSES